MWINKGCGVLLEKLAKAEGGEQLRGQPESTDSCPSWDKTSQRMRLGILAKRKLAQGREAHLQALAAAAALQEWIERLSWSTTRDRPDVYILSQSHGWWKRRSWRWSRRHHRALPEDSPVPSPTHSPLRHQRTKRLNCPSWSSIWGPHWSWGQKLSISSRSWPPYKGRAGQVIPPQSLQWRIMRNG